MEDMLKETSKTKTKRKRTPKKNWDNYKKSNTCIMGLLQGEERIRRNIWVTNDWEFSQINIRYQTIDPGSLVNTRKDKCQTKYT